MLLNVTTTSWHWRKQWYHGVQARNEINWYVSQSLNCLFSFYFRMGQNREVNGERWVHSNFFISFFPKVNRKKIHHIKTVVFTFIVLSLAWLSCSLFKLIYTGHNFLCLVKVLMEVDISAVAKKGIDCN